MKFVYFVNMNSKTAKHYKFPLKSEILIWRVLDGVSFLFYTQIDKSMKTFYLTI